MQENTQETRKCIVLRVDKPVYKIIRQYVFDNDTTLQNYILQTVLKDLKQKGIEVQQ